MLVSPYRVAPRDERPPQVRRLVEESWQRSLERKLDPDHLSPAFDLDDEALREYRREHPLSRVLPVIHSLVIAHTFESGLIVAIGDQAGRLLWIDGDRDLRRRAEGMLFVEGANWSEAAVGTSAPGTALALDHGIQIGGEEHFNRIVHPWSCTAVPVHDPRSGEVLGVIDITGGDDAVSPSTLPLLEAAVAAAESELRIQQLGEPRRRRQPSSRVPFASAQSRPRRAPQLDAPQLSVLGRELGRLTVHGRELQLSARHSEILTLLAWHPRGLSAEQLAQKLYPADNSVATLRAEMVRLRAALATLNPPATPTHTPTPAPGRQSLRVPAGDTHELRRVDDGRPADPTTTAALRIDSRPYRLSRPIELDAHRVLTFLERGAHRVALAAYAGPLLVGSEAPGIVEIRAEISGDVRESVLADASADVLLAYARTDECAYDRAVWMACLTRLPVQSPKRASVVTRIERIDEQVGPAQPSRNLR